MMSLSGASLRQISDAALVGEPKAVRKKHLEVASALTKSEDAFYEHQFDTSSSIKPKPETTIAEQLQVLHNNALPERPSDPVTT